MKQQLTLGSLFDGIGGWQLAAVRAGIVPIWSSEIEAFPIDVTRRHFPDTLQLGDVTKIDGGNIPPVDIICAGSHCQDLSDDGRRDGSQAYTARMRAIARPPRWLDGGWKRRRPLQSYRKRHGAAVRGLCIEEDCKGDGT